MPFQFKLITQGVTSYLSVNETSIPTRSKPSTIYTFENQSGNINLQSLELIREGDDLIIMADGDNLAVITDFYASSESYSEYLVEDGNMAEVESLPSSEGQLLIGSEHPDTGLVWHADPSMGIGTQAMFGALSLASSAVGLSYARSHSNPDTTVLDLSSYNITVDVMAGRFTSTVGLSVYDQVGNLLLTESRDMSNGSVDLTLVSDYSGPLLVVVSDINGNTIDYIDETTGNTVSLGTALRAMTVADGSTNIVVCVTPLTELATRIAGVSEADISLSEEDVTVNQQVAALFGVDDITSSVITVLDSEYDASDGSSAPEIYGEVLAMLSGADYETSSVASTLNLLTAVINENEDGYLTIEQEGVDLLFSGVDNFESGENKEIADLSYSIIKVPIIEGAEGGLNSDEVAAGVTITGSGVSAGDVVTILWGDEQTYDLGIVSTADINDDGDVDIIIPSETIDAAGNGKHSVRYQVNDDYLSPAVVINVDTESPITTISNIDISHDSGDLDNDFITNVESQTITATLSSALDSGEILYGSVDGGVSWFDITSMVSDTIVLWTGATLSGESSIRLKVTDAAGNEGTTERQDYTLDTVGPVMISENDAMDASLDSIVLIFDEDIVAGDGTGVITISGGSGGDLIYTASDSAVSIVGNTLAITPTEELEAETAYSVTMESDVATDIGGNEALVALGEYDFTTKTGTVTVVYDLVNGEYSMSDGASEFADDAEYHIIIIVDSDNYELVGDSGGTFSGASNLDSDDTIAIVGDGIAIINRWGNSATNFTLTNGSAKLKLRGLSIHATAIWLRDDGRVFRYANSNADQIIEGRMTALWTGTADLGELNQVTFANSQAALTANFT